MKKLKHYKNIKKKKEMKEMKEMKKMKKMKKTIKIEEMIKFLYKISQAPGINLIFKLSFHNLAKLGILKLSINKINQDSLSLLL
jgi:hypothetical protein